MRQKLGIAIGVTLVGLAIAQQLGRRPNQRTWQGKVLGFIPYDLRPPTLDRLRQVFWNPKGPLITARAFGVGWTINFYRLLHPVRSK